MKGKYIIYYKIIIILSCITSSLFSQSYLQIYEVKSVSKNKSQINVNSNEFNGDSISLTVISRRYLYKVDSLVIIYDSIIDGQFRISSDIIIPMGPSLKTGSVKAHHGIGVYDTKNKKIAFVNDSIAYTLNINDFPPYRIKGNSVVFENHNDIILKLRKSNHQTYYPFFNELFLNYEIEYFKTSKEEIKLKYSGKPIIFVDKKKILELKSLFSQKLYKFTVVFSEFILKSPK
jgi:hypothetical protein